MPGNCTVTGASIPWDMLREDLNLKSTKRRRGFLNSPERNYSHGLQMGKSKREKQT